MSLNISTRRSAEFPLKRLKFALQILRTKLMTKICVNSLWNGPLMSNPKCENALYLYDCKKLFFYTNLVRDEYLHEPSILYFTFALTGF